VRRYASHAKAEKRSHLLVVGDPLDLLRTWSGDHATLLRLFYEQDNLLCGTALQCIAAEGSTLQHIAKNSSISPGLA
jgi:hypothetical protein